MIIDCIADLHGFYPKLEGGDLLIIAGDIFANNKDQCRVDFINWVTQLPYREVVYIAGNHDNLLVGERSFAVEPIEDVGRPNVSYLCDDFIEYEGLKIYGSPWSRWFYSVNPKCAAFMLRTEDELEAKWKMIPDDIDILVTHTPPFGVLDKTLFEKHVGCHSLDIRVNKLRPKLHVFGHVHEQGGRIFDLNGKTRFINASFVNSNYEPVNPPIRIVL